MLASEACRDRESQLCQIGKTAKCSLRGFCNRSRAKESDIVGISAGQKRETEDHFMLLSVRAGPRSKKARARGSGVRVCVCVYVYIYIYTYIYIYIYLFVHNNKHNNNNPNNDDNNNNNNNNSNSNSKSKYNDDDNDVLSGASLRSGVLLSNRTLFKQIQF